MMFMNLLHKQGSLNGHTLYPPNIQPIKLLFVIVLTIEVAL